MAPRFVLLVQSGGQGSFRGRTLKWFKHYANANTNKMIQAIIEEEGLESAMRYWLLLELLCGEFKKEKVEFEFSTKQLRDALHFKSDRKLASFALSLTKVSAKFDQSSVEILKISEKFWKIKAPILLNLMGKEFKRTRQCSGTATPKKKEERIKKKEERYTVNKSDSSVLFDDINELFQEVCVKNGKFKSAPFYSGAAIENFITLTGFKFFQNVDNWKKYFETVSKSDFLNGENKSGWIASFSWLLVPENAQKVLEGQYSGEAAKSESEIEKLLAQMTPEERREMGYE